MTEITMQVVKLPLKNDPYYKYNIVLEDNSYTLEYLYVERNDSWYFSVVDSGGNYLVKNEKLVTDYLMCSEYALSNLTGGFILTATSTSPQVNLRSNFRDLDKYFTFYYTYEA